MKSVHVNFKIVSSTMMEFGEGILFIMMMMMMMKFGERILLLQ